jgi:hypothetical protein
MKAMFLFQEKSRLAQDNAIMDIVVKIVPPKIFGTLKFSKKV